LQLAVNHSVPASISLLSDISRLLTERVLDARHHGRGAAHFPATFIAVVTYGCCKLLVACCNWQVLTFTFDRTCDTGLSNCKRLNISTTVSTVRRHTTDVQGVIQSVSGVT